MKKIIEQDGIAFDPNTGDVAIVEAEPIVDDVDFFKKRMQEVCIVTYAQDPHYNNIIKVRDNAGVVHDKPLFERDEKGNIRINYYRLDAQPYTYKNDEGRWSKNFYRTRLFTERKGQQGQINKYHSPKGSGNYPYFPVQIINKYQAKEVIETLIITEGEFKAQRACLAGIDCIGVAGIHNFYDNNTAKKLHEDIVELVVTCKVKRLLFLTDADTLVVSWRPEKEMSDRPVMFYSAMKNFREAVMNMLSSGESECKDVYYGFIKTELAKSNQKGLDDLINQQIDKQKVVNALKELSFMNPFFQIINMTDGLNRLQEMFGVKDAANFYMVYQDYLKLPDGTPVEFQFRRQNYVWNTETEKIEKLKHKDIDNYMRVGCDWFHVVQVPNKHGDTQEEIKKWSIGEIQRDYGKKNPHFIDDIPKYDAWCNIPSMMVDSYKRVHNGCFNLFNPIAHGLADGVPFNTLFFMKHLFGGKGSVTMSHNVATRELEIEEVAILGDPFTVALDYLTVMYQYPDQILPVPCLVSEANGTGKSTFLKWLKDIYGSNATIIDNERFKQNFNSHYITKFIIGIDEGFLDVEKRAEKERLKKLATDDKQFLEFKGADVQEVDFYGKIIICSNDAKSLMKIEDGEIRWFVIEVPTFASQGYPEDPEFRNKMRSEIPCWLNYIKNRKIVHPKEGRAWFKPEYIMTDQLRVIIEHTRNYLDKVVDDYIEDMFKTYQVAEIKISMNYLTDMINKSGVKYRVDKISVMKYLKEKKKLTLSEKPEYISTPCDFSEEGMSIIYFKQTARYVTLKREIWLKNEVATPPALEEAVAVDSAAILKDENAPF